MNVWERDRERDRGRVLRGWGTGGISNKNVELSSEKWVCSKTQAGIWTAWDTEDLNLTNHDCFLSLIAWYLLAMASQPWPHMTTQEAFIYNIEIIGHHPQKFWFNLSGLYDLASVLFKSSPLILMRNRVTNHEWGKVPEPCQLKTGTRPQPLQGLGHEGLRPLTFDTPWKEFRAEIRNEAPCAPGKTGGTGLQRVVYFQEKLLWAQFPASPHI